VLGSKIKQLTTGIFGDDYEVWNKKKKKYKKISAEVGQRLSDGGGVARKTEKDDFDSLRGPGMLLIPTDKVILEADRCYCLC